MQTLLSPAFPYILGSKYQIWQYTWTSHGIKIAAKMMAEKQEIVYALFNYGYFFIMQMISNKAGCAQF